VPFLLAERDDEAVLAWVKGASRRAREGEGKKGARSEGQSGTPSLDIRQSRGEYQRPCLGKGASRRARAERVRKLCAMGNEADLLRCRNGQYARWEHRIDNTSVSGLLWSHAICDCVTYFSSSSRTT
jgi:hypothetical protein